jgi:hypothetical protein
LDDLEALRRALAAAPAARLGQAWLPAPDPAFRPGSVRCGRSGDSLLVLSELDDEDVFTGVTGPNQRFWELGDTFEMFLEAEKPSAYVELHVAPGNQRLQLRIPLPRTSAAPESLMTAPRFGSRVWTEPGRWIVGASIPFSTIGGAPARYSFSRYDYTRGDPRPVHSSTSPHAALDFHRREEWGKLTLA